MDQKNTWMLEEREKELECMYAVDEILQNRHLSLPAIMEGIIKVLPSGFTQPNLCQVEIVLNDVHYTSPDFYKATYLHQTPILIDLQKVGVLEVRYFIASKEKAPNLLTSEIKIMNAVAGRISQVALNSQRELSIILDMLQRVNPDILERVCQRLQIYIHSLEEHSSKPTQANPTYGEVNTPLPKLAMPDMLEYGRKLIAQATTHSSMSEIYELINNWIQDEWLFSLVKIIGNQDASVSEILDAVRNYTRQATCGQTHSPTEKWVLAELAHRFLTTDEELINHVLEHLCIDDFEYLISHVIGATKSTGNIGGKGAGLFLASTILNNLAETEPLLTIKTPRTWYLPADQLNHFLRYNHMEEMHSYKYNSISYIRMTYDHMVSKIKNGQLPSHILQILDFLLDDLKDTPIIVRSSSLLEDRSNSAFSGKYKSLFLPNQGSKKERLEALVDAILEVYSSQYNPDSIQYRAKRHLLHFSEQMGILIQEVVGTKIGPYYMPLLAGVAFSENPLCWSPRIQREGGLVRLVMGLGTRAVDRVNDDYPLLFSPQSPGFHINQNPDDIKHYSPKFVDLIHLEEKTFKTIPIDDFLKQWGNEFPKLHRLVSVYHPEYMQKKNIMELSPQKDDMVVTFAGVLEDTDFAAKIKRILAVLQDKMGIKVDLEFAYDGESLYLLQCRTLNQNLNKEPPALPKQLSREDILFTGNRFVSNGCIEQIRYVVYVEGREYKRLTNLNDMLSVGNAVGLLNERLPRRKYILMGPGRWGSRGDIQLGVRLTYADICNTAVLIEVAKKQQSYVPELSFGTHFFQDLVESDISYLPLYPDQDDNILRERFFTTMPNHLSDLLPQYAHLSKVLYVVDLWDCKNKKTLSLYMNATKNQAVAFLTDDTGETPSIIKQEANQIDWKESGKDQHWQWRKYMAEQLSKEMDMTGFGVKGIYLFGSTDTESAGIGSDIDLLIHFIGNQVQRDALLHWLDGYGLALAKINYLRTGHLSNQGLLDIHLVTDEDIRKKDSFAIKINSVMEPATPLRVL